MNLRIICVGKTNQSYLIEGERIYLERLRHYVSIEKIELPDVKFAQKLSRTELKEKEGELILKLIKDGELLFLLDENGKHFTSVAFSEFMQKQLNRGAKQLSFVIGGAFGFSEAVYDRADGKISLSQMTFSHQMVRLFFLEQLYRSFTILRGEQYHHA